MDFELRMIISEEYILRNKIYRVEALVKSDLFFEKKVDEQDLLIQQLSHMHSYMNTLRKRIKLWLK